MELNNFSIKKANFSVNEKLAFLLKFLPLAII